MALREGAHRSGRHGHAAGESSKKSREHRKKKAATTRPATTSTADESREPRRKRRPSSSRNLSAGALAQLNRENDRRKRQAERDRRKHHGGEYHEVDTTPRSTPRKPRKNHKSRKKRVVSGAVMEEGRAGRSGLRGGGSWGDVELEKEELHRRHKKEKSRKRLWMMVGITSVVIIVIVVVAVVVGKKNGSDNDSPSTSSALKGKDPNQVPAQWKNTYLDPWSWKTTTDFNVTFTDQMVGGLPVMGLFSEWDDSAKANDKVPALNEDWGPYGSRPARGVNLGGWLSLEPFITPSLFDYNVQMGIVDEWTLCRHLGESAASNLESHYASFVTEDTFKAIAAAGLDHVRIPFSYWAVEVYDGDAYVFRASWRYLLRGIEWARKYGLRVNLDLHGLPGSQNGWNHSGRWGAIGWLNGTDGALNGKRSLEIHDRLSQFFAQERYKNILTHYGLANEPRMTFLKTADVVQWTEDAYKIVRRNGVRALVIFGDGFMGLDNWKGLMTGYDDMVLDVHQYVIFNENQIVFSHQKKIEYACEGWTRQTLQSMNTQTGYGPTIFAEWSQADTDCARHLTNVGWGNRWEGTLDTGSASTSVLTPRCPTKDSSCSCAQANADPSKYGGQYKKFLQMFAEAQMHSFEKGWGWWYWTWKTESAPLWSYEAALKAGIMPSKAHSRDFNCDSDVPDFAKSGLAENY
ncbi:exo-beta-1,3-glucanase [Metarhizium album ARSEF 1941]|uniref:glucan 1,3-beta-glucosidase n=1 Tax=Metarhizium album (strain ARSEF 1941) TaxID=1081103 RepID=A0A0B2X7R4_METAS|nr:exo-beta-1,3-glucanase [Metarhizium album ARSEF 1941]KHO01773.1 exo-beta-1,3-glucanase [Metarhizium album ARSEF 1941]